MIAVIFIATIVALAFTGVLGWVRGARVKVRARVKVGVS